MEHQKRNREADLNSQLFWVFLNRRRHLFVVFEFFSIESLVLHSRFALLIPLAAHTCVIANCNCATCYTLFMELLIEQLMDKEIGILISASEI